MEVTLCGKFRRLAVTIFVFNIFLCDKTDAQFTSQFSLAVGEEYNDNIFFSKQKEHDFITNITPTLSLVYQPAGRQAPTFNVNISPTALIFARHSDQNNFGRNLGLNGSYRYDYSPRLSFYLGDALQTRGTTRTVGLGENQTLQGPRIPFTPGTPGLPAAQRLGDFISNGETVDNSVFFQGDYLFSPNITISGGYRNGFTAFLDRGGNEIRHSAGMRGVYRWGQEHNIHAGYTVDVIKSRDGKNNIVHNFDIGDDYFSSRQIQLTPTLTITASSGISLNAGNDGPRIANNTNVTLTKIWETAIFTGGVRKGLTSSFGVSDISDTVNVYSDFRIRLTDRLSGSAGVDYALFNTDDVNFKPFQAYGGLQYAVTHWLCSNLTYRHRRLFSGPGGRNTDLRTEGNVYGNSVLLNFSVRFNIWPAVGLAAACPVSIPTPAPQSFPQ